MLGKLLLHTKDGKILMVTLSHDQLRELDAALAFFGTDISSKQGVDVVKSFVLAGKYTALRLTTKSRAEIVEELRRNYGDKFVDLGEGNGQ